MKDHSMTRFNRKRKMAVMKKMVEIQDKKKIRVEIPPDQFVDDDYPNVLITVAWIVALFALIFLILWIVTGEVGL